MDKHEHYLIDPTSREQAVLFHLARILFGSSHVLCDMWMRQDAVAVGCFAFSNRSAGVILTRMNGLFSDQVYTNTLNTASAAAGVIESVLRTTLTKKLTVMGHLLTHPAAS